MRGQLFGLMMGKSMIGKKENQEKPAQFVRPVRTENVRAGKTKKLRFFKGWVLASLLCLLAGCSQAPEGAEEEPERFLLTMETFTDGSVMDLAGETAASIINNTVPGAHVQVSESKGSPVNAENVDNGSVDLVMVSGETAWDACNGTGVFEGEPKEKLRVLAACYPVLSAWTAKADTGLSWVHDLKEGFIGTGTEGSVTERMSKLSLSVMGIDEENTYFEPLGLSEGMEWVLEDWALASHSFDEVPSGSWQQVPEGTELVFLKYTQEELDAILKEAPFLYQGELPAGTFAGQQEAVSTFGVKVLLCASSDMDEELAYEIAMAMDVNGPVYAGGHGFMSAMLEEEFLCNDLPAPLHEGARRYYEESGYLQ